MEAENYKIRLAQVIEKIKEENKKEGSANLSYKYLLTNLSEINSVEDIRIAADRILFFLADSYFGSKEILEELGDLLLPYKHKKKKK